MLLGRAPRPQEGRREVSIEDNVVMQIFSLLSKHKYLCLIFALPGSRC